MISRARNQHGLFFAAQLDFGRTFASSEVASPVAHEIDRGNSLCHSRWMIDQRRKLYDSMAESNVLRTRGARRRTRSRGR